MATASIVEPDGTEVPLRIGKGMALPDGAGSSCEITWRMSSEGFGDQVAELFLAVSDAK